MAKQKQKQKPQFKGVCFKCGRKVFNANELERHDQTGHFVCKAKNFCK